MDPVKVSAGLKEAIAGLAAPDPFAAASGTPHLDAFQPTAPLAGAELERVLSGVDAATRDRQGLAQLGAILAQVVGVAKAFAVVLLVLCLPLASAGCSTPPSIREAHRIEGDALETYRADVGRALTAYEADLALALDRQVELIRDYELRLAATDDGHQGKTVDLATVTQLLSGAKAKRAEIEGKLAAARAKMGGVDLHYRTARAIHERIGAYLESAGVSAEDAGRLIRDVASMRAPPPSVLPAGPAPGAGIPAQ